MEMYCVKLRNLREDHDLRQEDIAQLLHTTQRAYSYYETGQRDIPIPMLIRLSRYYNVSVDYILGETNSKKRYPKN